MISFLMRVSRRIVSANLRPKEPVPPVSNTVRPVQSIIPPQGRRSVAALSSIPPYSTTSSRGMTESVSQPCSVITTSSSMRTPPIPGR